VARTKKKGITKAKKDANVGYEAQDGAISAGKAYPDPHARSTAKATPGATVTAIQLFEQLPEHPIITMPLVTRLLSTTKPTAGKAIDVLIKAGVLAEVGERKRDRLYRYDRYLQLLD
jgi:hypothetical protein